MATFFKEPAKWKREQIADHKFDFVDVDEFVNESLATQFYYSLIFLYTLRSVLTYFAEIGVVILLILQVTGDQGTQNGGSINLTTGQNGTFSKAIPVNWRIGFVAASVAVSFLLLAMDWRKAFLIIKSRDISYAFTSTVAYRYYAIRSFPHYCFFRLINNSKKIKDVLSFWVYFRLKGWILKIIDIFTGWKRLILAEAPRQLLNALTLIDLINAATVDPASSIPANADPLSKYFRAIQFMFGSQKNQQVLALIGLATFTVVLWIIHFLGLLVAAFIYIYLLVSIRGNLKEYCVHKIDKRIDELLKKNSRKRIREARKAELEELERNGQIDQDGQKRALPPLGLTRGPVLPNVGLNVEDDYINSSQYGSESQFGGEYQDRVMAGYYQYDEYDPRFSYPPQAHLYQHGSQYSGEQSVAPSRYYSNMGNGIEYIPEGSMGNSSAVINQGIEIEMDVNQRVHMANLKSNTGGSERGTNLSDEGRVYFRERIRREEQDE